MPKKVSKINNNSASLATIQTKLCEIHKDLDENKKDISELKEQISMGKGGVKVLVWVSALVVSILGWNIFNGTK